MKGLEVARAVHDSRNLYVLQATKDCEHSRIVNAMPHDTADDAGDSFEVAVGLGLITRSGLLTCTCGFTK
jgi:hypothetical protein